MFAICSSSALPVYWRVRLLLDNRIARPTPRFQPGRRRSRTTLPPRPAPDFASRWKKQLMRMAANPYEPLRSATNTSEHLRTATNTSEPPRAPASIYEAEQTWLPCVSVTRHSATATARRPARPAMTGVTRQTGPAALYQEVIASRVRFSPACHLTSGGSRVIAAVPGLSLAPDPPAVIIGNRSFSAF